jgi:hypothetical protein
MTVLPGQSRRSSARAGAAARTTSKARARKRRIVFYSLGLRSAASPRPVECSRIMLRGGEGTRCVIRQNSWRYPGFAASWASALAPETRRWESLKTVVQLEGTGSTPGPDPVHPVQKKRTPHVGLRTLRHRAGRGSVFSCKVRRRRRDLFQGGRAAALHELGGAGRGESPSTCRVPPS